MVSSERGILPPAARRGYPLRQRILVINPNSNASVTAALDRAVAGLRFADGPEIVCVTLEEGPRGIETQRHVDQVVAPLCALIARADNASAAFVIACFGDPGLDSAKETTARPVFGICQAGVTTALNHGEKVGILTNIAADVNPGLRHMRTLGLESRIAGVEPIGIPVTGLDEAEPSRRALVAAALRLKEKGAEVFVTGCAGMTPYKGDIEAATGLAVIDPTLAAVGMALTAVRAS
jgi:allantoin racemase